MAKYIQANGQSVAPLGRPVKRSVPIIGADGADSIMEGLPGAIDPHRENGPRGATVEWEPLSSVIKQPSNKCARYKRALAEGSRSLPAYC